jgi:ubiquitin carboxyl-terminal hydrolase 5/13
LPASYQLRSIVCHKGTSVHAGWVLSFWYSTLEQALLIFLRHYVALVRKVLPNQDQLSWVMFNDEKVVKFDDIEGIKKTAYMYFFTRV